MPVPRPPDLDALERAAFRKFFEDGLMDIFLGLVLALMPLAAVLEKFVGDEPVASLIYGGVLMALVLVLTLVRPRLLRPRLGAFTPRAPRRRKIRRSVLALVGSVLVGLLIWAIFAAGKGGSILPFMPFVWLLNCVLVFGAMAYFLDVPRFFYYGLLFGGPLAIDAFVHLNDGRRLPLALTFVLPGLSIVGIGVYKLVHFLRDYPPRAPEAHDGSP